MNKKNTLIGFVIGLIITLIGVGMFVFNDSNLTLTVKWSIFNSISLTVLTFFYVIITFLILIENQKLNISNQSNKKNEITSLLFAFFNKYSIEEDTNKKINGDNDYIYIKTDDWQLLKLKVLNNSYLFPPKYATLLIKTFAEDKILVSPYTTTSPCVIIDKNNSKYIELLTWINKEYKYIKSK